MEIENKEMTVVNPAGFALLPTQEQIKTQLQIADQLQKSGFFPDTIKNPGQAFAVIQYGQEIGLSPMVALANIYNIQGRPSPKPEILHALIRMKFPKAILRPVEESSKGVTWEAARPGDPASKFSFTWEDALRAELPSGKNAHSWKKYPKNMMRARVIADIARALFPDVILGLSWTPDELDATVDLAGNPVDVSPPSAKKERLTKKESAAMKTAQAEALDAQVVEAPAAAPIVEEQPAEIRITKEQAKEMFHAAKKNGWTEGGLKEMLFDHFKVVSSGELTLEQYEKAMRIVSEPELGASAQP